MALVIGVSVAVVSPAGAALGGPDRRVAAPGRTGIPQDAPLAALQEQVIARAGGAFGVRYDETAGRFAVLYPRGEATGAARFGALADRVRVEESRLSAATVTRFAEAMEARRFHASAGDYHYGSYVDLDSDVIVLGTDAPATVVSPLVARFGDAVEVRFGESGRLRQSDPQPHWGGASITGGGSVCTSGVTGLVNGVRVMTTAGHCFPPGSAITSTGGGQAWGTFIRHPNYPNLDVGIVTGTTYQGAIYIGSASSTTGAAVASFGDPVIGFSNYCFSGQTSGERCGHTVVSFGGTVCGPAGCTFNLTVSNGFPGQPGDSGSPWFVFSSGNITPVHIRGIFSAMIAGQNYWHRNSQYVGVIGVPFP